MLERLRDRGKAWGCWAWARRLCAASIVVTGAITFVNYIPDDVSNALFGLALPLLKDGYLPPSALNVLGLSNPAAGVLLLGLLLGLAGWVSWRLGTSEGSRPGAAHLLAGLATLAVLLGAQAATARHHAADQGAVRFLEKLWLVPPGRSLDFQPPPPEPS